MPTPSRAIRTSPAPPRSRRAARGCATPLRIAVPAPEGGSIFSSPWFWIPAGVIIVGGAVATALIVSQSSTTSTVSVNVRE